MNRQRRQRSTKRCREVFLKKLALSVLTLVLVIGFSITLGGNFVKAESNSNSESVQHKYYKSIVIESGDTLWEIAAENKGSHYDSIYDYIDELMSINSLDTDEIHAGQYLTIPYYDYL